MLKHFGGKRGLGQRGRRGLLQWCVYVVTNGRSTATGQQHCNAEIFCLHPSKCLGIIPLVACLPGHKATQSRSWVPTFRRNLTSERWSHNVLQQYRNPHSRPNPHHHKLETSCNGSVGTVAGYDKDDRGISFRILAGTRYCLSTPKFPLPLSDPHRVYLKGAGLRYKRRSHSPPSSDKVKDTLNYTSTPPYSHFASLSNVTWLLHNTRYSDGCSVSAYGPRAVCCNW